MSRSRGDAGIVVGVDFGHTHLRVAIGNLAHRVLAEEAEPLDVDASAAQGLDRAEHLVNTLIAKAGISRDKIVGVGLGVPGPIDVESGVLGSTAILPGWASTNPRDDLSARLGVPVYVDNDANLGALGELVWGAGRGATDLAYIKVASGVGAGLVIKGQIYRGPGGTAGEIGHITLDESGPVCRCGNRGCLETFTAARYVLPLLHSAHGTDLTVARMVQLAKDGDPGCRRVIVDVGLGISAAAWRTCATCSIRAVSCSAATSRTPASWCSRRSANPSRGTRSPAPHGSWRSSRAPSAAARRCSARSRSCSARWAIPPCWTRRPRLGRP
ncbi:hypothetical protein GCM10020000_18500 [Streptomyces olivoverticillatus]